MEPPVKNRKPQSNVPFSEAAIRRNASIVDYISTSMSALSGATAGLLGLTGLHGFAFYFICAFASWLLLLTKAGTQWEKYFHGRLSLLTQGLFSGLFTYVLFWTFLYGMVHVY